jgi:hypothetical protein
MGQYMQSTAEHHIAGQTERVQVGGDTYNHCARDGPIAICKSVNTEESCWKGRYRDSRGHALSPLSA